MCRELVLVTIAGHAIFSRMVTQASRARKRVQLRSARSGHGFQLFSGLPDSVQFPVAQSVMFQRIRQVLCLCSTQGKARGFQTQEFASICKLQAKYVDDKGLSFGTEIMELDSFRVYSTPRFSRTAALIRG